MTSFLQEARKGFHAALFKEILFVNEQGIPSNADKDSRISVAIAKNIVEQLGAESKGARLAGQMSGSKFETVCKEYIEETFLKLTHMRPGIWKVGKGPSISEYDQYRHLIAVGDAAQANPELAAAIGLDYLIKPDVVIMRYPEEDDKFNAVEKFIGPEVANLSSVRKKNNLLPILHASISCKWTLRSDRAQNARAEALNLVRNRKGPLPHVVVLTAEPMPSRVSSLALGTGDIDCVYHFALPELMRAVKELKFEDAEDTLNIMVQGKRLRDVADLPLDLIT